MKTEHEIHSEFYRIIKDSDLHNAAGGLVIKSPNLRPKDSPTDDIVISTLSSNLAQIQEVDLNINIFVHDETVDGQPTPSPKIKVLSRLALDLLESIVECDYNAKIASQRTYKVEGVNQHCINNRIYYRTNN